MTSEQYVIYVIDRLARTPDGKADHYGERTRLWTIHMPRWQWLARSLTLQWVYARFQYLNPRCHIQNSISFYDKKTGADVGFLSASAKLSAAKGQVTKAENAIAEYVKNFQPTLFILRAEDTEPYQKAMVKINAKRAALEAAEREYEAEKAKLSNSQNSEE